MADEQTRRTQQQNLLDRLGVETFTQTQGALPQQRLQELQDRAAGRPLQMGPQQFAAPAVAAPVRPQPSPGEQIEQLILTARLRQGRPRDPRSPSELEFTSRARQVINAGMLGFGAEVSSRLGQQLLDLTDEERQQLESLIEQDIAQRREAEPGTSLAIEAGTAGALGGVAAPLFRGATTIPQVVTRGAGLGTVAGGLAGAGEAPPGQRAEGALMGGTIGAFIGAGAPLVLSATAAGLRNAVGRIRGQTTQRNAADRVLAALDAEEITLDQARQRLNELGVEATLADVSGETRRLLRAASTDPGRASAQTRQILEARTEGQGRRILDELEQALPVSTSFQGTVDDLVTQRATAARPLYEAAYQVDIPFTEDLQRLFRRPAIRRAWETAQELAANEDIVLPQLFVRGADGELTLQTVNAPVMPAIDFIKRALDDIVETSRDQLTGKVVGDRARSVATVRRELLELVDEINPTYRLARQAFAGPSGSLDALHLGRRFARGDPEILQRQLDRLSPNDQAFFRMGVAEGIREQVLRTPDGVNAARRIAGNELARERLRAVFPDDASFRQFIAAMDAETEFFKTSNMALGGSPTAPRLAETQSLAEPLVSAGVDVATGQPGPGAFAALARALGPRGTVVDPRLRTELARMLTAQGGDLQGILQELTRRQAGTQAGSEAQALISALTAAGGGAQAPRLR